MNRNTQIVFGSRSESDVRFGQSAGKQCTGMCVAFAVHSHGQCVDSFQWKGIDKILDSGNKIYEQCSDFYEKEILAGDELPRYVTYGDIRYKLSVGQFRFGFLQDQTNLTYHVTNAFCMYTSMLFMCKGFTVILKYCSGHYYIFDSHKKDKYGRAHADGKSSVMKFTHFHEMITYLVKHFSSENREQYDLVPLAISSELVKTGTNPEIKCHFKKRRTHMLNVYEANVLPAANVSSSDAESYVTDHSLNTDEFIHVNSKNGLSRKSDSYETERSTARQYNSDGSTCTLGKHGSILYIDNEIIEQTVRAENSKEHLSDVSNGTGTKKNVKIKMKRVKGKWCTIQKDCSQVGYTLRNSDKKQISELQNNLPDQEGMKILLTKENGVWKLEEKSKKRKSFVSDSGIFSEDSEFDEPRKLYCMNKRAKVCNMSDSVESLNYDGDVDDLSTTETANGSHEKNRKTCKISDRSAPEKSAIDEFVKDEFSLEQSNGKCIDWRIKKRKLVECFPFISEEQLQLLKGDHDREKRRKKKNKYRVEKGKFGKATSQFESGNVSPINTHFGNPCVNISITDFIEFSSVANNVTELETSGRDVQESEEQNTNTFYLNNETNVEDDNSPSEIGVVDFDELGNEGIQIEQSRIDRMNEGLDFMCIFCGKICFREQVLFLSESR